MSPKDISGPKDVSRLGDVAPLPMNEPTGRGF